LARDPSPAALAQRVKQLEDHQLTARQLDALLVSSDEFLAHFHLTTTQWVNWVYRARVGWTPTAAQLDRWVAAVAVHGRDYVANVFEQSPHARLTAVLHIEELLIQRASTGASLAHWVNLDTDTSDLTVKAELAATGEAFAVATPVVAVPLSATSFDFTAGVAGDAVLAGYDTGYFTSTDLPAGLSLQEVVDHLTFSTHLVGTVATPGTYTAHIAIHAYPIRGSWVIATTTITIHVAS
jgi:hypothetical protein